MRFGGLQKEKLLSLAVMLSATVSISHSEKIRLIITILKYCLIMDETLSLFGQPVIISDKKSNMSNNFSVVGQPFEKN